MWLALRYERQCLFHKEMIIISIKEASVETPSRLRSFSGFRTLSTSTLLA